MAEPWVSRSVTSSMLVSTRAAAMDVPAPAAPMVLVGSSSTWRRDKMPTMAMMHMKSKRPLWLA